MVNDPISELVTRLKNAANAKKHETIVMGYSNVKSAVADTLETLGFVKNVTKKAKTAPRSVEIDLVFDEKTGAAKIHDVIRISKPSKRIYGSSSKIQPYKNGLGFTILTTSNGVMTDKEARKQKVGGEVLFKIW
jgi:small subunit ribosomal protein S8